MMLSNKDLPKLIRKFLIEMVIYGVLLVIYFFAVLRFLGDMLNNLYLENTILYAVVGLGLIVLQAVALEAVTSYLLRLLRLDRLD
jgi:hypothetical protein